VFALQRRFATPVPAMGDMDQLNRHLLECCLKERERTVRGRTSTIGRMFQEEAAAAAALPSRPFDTAVVHQRQADKYQCVTFEDVRDSVPRQAAFSPVMLTAYLDPVVLVRDGQEIARHPRSRKAGEHVLDSAHFLEVLERKPAYLEKTRLFNELKLPEVFARLRRELEGQWGAREGKRQYIQTLQLLGSYSQEHLAAAIEASLGARQLRAGVIRLRLEEQAGGPQGQGEGRKIVAVPPPDLGRFNELLSGPALFKKEKIDVQDDVASGAEPQDAEASDGAGGICPPLA
jgi:hypothetical protein